MTQEKYTKAIEKIIKKIKPLKREIKLVERSLIRGRTTSVVFYALGDYLRISGYTGDEMAQFAKLIKKSIDYVYSVAVGNDVVITINVPLNKNASNELEAKIKKTLKTLDLPTKNDPKWIDYAAKHIAKGIKK